MIEQKFNVIVIGGGAAGLAAAIAAKESGVDSVLVLERDETFGGVLPQCVHTGFGLHYFKENLTGPEYVSRFIKKATNLEISYKLETMILDLSPKKEVLAINKRDGLLKFRSEVIVLAMGCRERSRGALNIPGTRPAGIFTAGTAQRLMDVEGYVPGDKIMILGSGDIGLIMARRFAMEGLDVKGVVEVMPYPGGLDRNLQILRDFNIPLHLGYAATFIHGTERVEAVTISKLDERGRRTDKDETIECNTLILSAGLIPENELSRKAGIELEPRTGGPVVDENWETSVGGIFACGNVVHVHDLVDHVTQDGEEVGKNAAKKILGELPSLGQKIRLKAGINIRYIVPQLISSEKPLKLYTRVTEPAFDVRITLGNIMVHKRVVKPPELIDIDLTSNMLKDMGSRDELIVSLSK